MILLTVTCTLLKQIYLDIHSFLLSQTAKLSMENSRVIKRNQFCFKYFDYRSKVIEKSIRLYVLGIKGSSIGQNLFNIYFYLCLYQNETNCACWHRFLWALIGCVIFHINCILDPGFDTCILISIENELYNSPAKKDKGGQKISVVRIWWCFFKKLR